MAATMAVATMVTKSKESWSLHLPELTLPWNSQEGRNGVEFPHRALFASISLNRPPPAARDPLEHDTRARPRPTDNCDIARQLEAMMKGKQEGEVEEMIGQQKKKGTCGRRQRHQLGALRKKLLRVKITNPHVRRLVSGAIAGAVSRTIVAPLETIRTHLMVSNSGADSMDGVFQWIMRTEGWTGLFRGNIVNVLRVAPSKAIEAR
jgi:solute carrier family 25 (mitochondrial phosphate transporter), member 23/24/25/41